MDPLSSVETHKPVSTFFASPERSSAAEIATEIDTITESAVVEGMLRSVQGLLAVLNEHRQILAVNDAYLRDLRITNGDALLGLRHGEALHCVHAEDNPAGCGTGKFCATCGAAIALVSTLVTNAPEERRCVMTIDRDGLRDEVIFSVKASVIASGKKKYVLLFLRDLTEEEKRASIERVFFHDLNNLVMALSGLAEVVAYKAFPGLEMVVKKMRFLSRRLVREVQIQKALSEGEGYQLQKEAVTLETVLAALKGVVDELPQGRGRKVTYCDPIPAILHTDLPLLVRILTNMAVNAFEASPEGGAIRIAAEREDNTITFKVWNDGVIPGNVAMRIFQRFFSTKEGRGRGLGTYSMKFFGEQYLGGKVDFQTSVDSGTTFMLRLPLA